MSKIRVIEGEEGEKTLLAEEPLDSLPLSFSTGEMSVTVEGSHSAPQSLKVSIDYQGEDDREDVYDPVRIEDLPVEMHETISIHLVDYPEEEYEFDPMEYARPSETPKISHLLEREEGKTGKGNHWYLINVQTAKFMASALRWVPKTQRVQDTEEYYDLARRLESVTEDTFSGDSTVRMELSDLNLATMTVALEEINEHLLPEVRGEYENA